MDNYQELGVERVEWLGLDACEICQPNIDQGPIPLGSEFESGDTEPPGHANCRCSILPVIESDVNLSDRAEVTKFVPTKTDAELAQQRLETLANGSDLRAQCRGWLSMRLSWICKSGMKQFYTIISLSDRKATSPVLKTKKVAKHIDAMGQAL
jgi:uncharacterized protein with gpF-like domain